MYIYYIEKSGNFNIITEIQKQTQSIAYEKHKSL